MPKLFICCHDPNFVDQVTADLAIHTQVQIFADMIELANHLPPKCCVLLDSDNLANLFYKLRILAAGTKRHAAVKVIIRCPFSQHGMPPDLANTLGEFAIDAVLCLDSPPALVALTVRQALAQLARIPSAGQRPPVAKDEAVTIKVLSHEINNALMSSDGYCGLLLQELGRMVGDADQVARCMQFAMRMRRNFQHSLAIVKDVLRLDKGSLDLQYCALRELIDHALENVTFLAAEAKVALRGQLIKPSLEVYVDRFSVVQILTNLLKNAIEAVKDSEERWVQIKVNPQVAAGIEVLVLDSGEPLSAIQSQRLFDPFFTTKNAASGNGLGLWHSRELAQRLGGRLQYDGGLGHTCFSLLLPKSLPDSQHEAEGPAGK